VLIVASIWSEDLNGPKKWTSCVFIEDSPSLLPETKYDTVVVEEEDKTTNPDVKKDIEALNASRDAAVQAYMTVNQRMKNPAFAPTGQDFQLLLTMMNQT
jgi:hypothetical protein